MRVPIALGIDVNDIPNFIKDVSNFVKDVPRVSKCVSRWESTSNHFHIGSQMK